ncbi:DUF1697 domain-containing protein [Maribacter sp. 2210JD10-5]|uniref:DUF1697 domain-containing protein n=1 Tax=Maribacter sp. 2210JD10-5 TaxID=3386272 RepID=UPI0039BCF4BA
METYIALLRGINVSGQKKVPMAELRKILEDEEMANIKTYIQSGNVIFKSESNYIIALEKSIMQKIEKYFGFKVPVLVKKVSDIKMILAANPFDNTEDLEHNRIYFVLLQTVPEILKVKEFETEKFVNEAFKITDHCVYLSCKNGYGKAKLNNNLIERKLKVKATTRNYRTMKKLLELSED